MRPNPTAFVGLKHYIDLLHTGRPAPAFLGKGQIHAHGENGHVLAKPSRLGVKTPGFHVADRCIQRGHCCNDDHFSAVIRELDRVEIIIEQGDVRGRVTHPDRVAYQG